MKPESDIQKEIIKDIYNRFPGCIVLKSDSSYIQGIPDLLVLYKDRWAALEVKQHAGAGHRPNQDYYVKMMNEMSFSAFIFPENKEEIYDAMEQSFTRRSRRRARVSRS